MVAAGVHIVPLMPSPDVVALVVEAEQLGYDYCMVADEGVHPDISHASAPQPAKPNASNSA